jgi:glutamate 5-kinase
MATKLQAADIARRAGIEVIIAAGSAKNVVVECASDKPLGTRFVAMSDSLENRKRWILAGPSTTGDIVIDAGAVTALERKGSSLLAKGVISVRGQFARGDVARVVDVDGKLIAKGLASYSSADLNIIKGMHSKQIGEALGHDYGSVIIHRDDLVMMQD